MATQFDAIVIGTGQAGPSMADRFDEEGMSVAVIERKLFGGTCVNVGCIPTKALVASARAAHMARRGSHFGIEISGDVSVDMKRVKARKDEIVAQSNQGVTGWMQGLDKGSIYEGHGRFVSAGSVSVNGDLLEADKIFVNVGARAAVPPIPGLDEVDFLTNASVMEIDYLPEHLMIIGGSYIALEFAQMYRRFGSQVTVIERGPHLISREDEDVSRAIRDILEAEGVSVLCEAAVGSVARSGSQTIVRLETPEGHEEIAGSHLLMAVGRRPNTDDLGLEEAGVATDGRGFIAVDDTLRTNVEGIWAVGDCNGLSAFTHTSYNDFEIVAANLFDDDPRKVSDRIPCYGLFVDPPLGRVGMTESQVRASGRPALVGNLAMERVGRARERSETDGFIKIIVDAESHQILGAAILGINGDEVVHSLLDVMYARAPYTVIQRAVHIHPTVSELIPTVLGDLEPLT